MGVHPLSSANRFVLQIVVPALVAVAMMAGLVAALILYSATQADKVADQREQQIVATVLKQSIDRTAHDQEGATVWDDAVEKVRASPLDLAWVDSNLGTWMHTYYGHDEAFIVNGANRALYAMRQGKSLPPKVYDAQLRALAEPLLAELRAKLARPYSRARNSSVLTPGAIDLAVVAGHPAIVSVKPIVSDTGRIIQRPGSEAMHISVRYLDNGFAQDLAASYDLESARFSTSPPGDGAESAAPLRSAAGKELGYLTWKPFRPGTLMVRRTAPMLAIALLVMFAVVAVLLRHVRRSTIALEAKEKQAQHLAFHDVLTGLPNRAMFEDRLAHELARARNAAGAPTLLYLDLDGFKWVNDTLGHPAGDELIRAVAGRLATEVRSTDLVARMGGDEFAIIQCGVSSPAEAEILCLRIIEAIHAPFDVAGSQVRVGISVGIACAPGDAEEHTELTRKADIALYQAKATGKGRFVFFAEAMDAGIRSRTEIEAGLREALVQGDQFEVYYQPLYSSRTGEINGAEALLRWHHPERGMISPAIFVPIAEDAGLIRELGEWVLRQACRTALRWPIGTISVNVSAVQLRDADFARRTLAILDAIGLPPARLEIEITETSFIENAESCKPNLVALRAQGVKVALDDFGTGYSSFSHLSHFQVDRLKIDRSFVNGIGPEPEESAIIRAIMDIANASGLKVTAEGVETAEQNRYLTRMGCDTLQGFLLARPMPAEKLDVIFGLAAAVDVEWGNAS